MTRARSSAAALAAALAALAGCAATPPAPLPATPPAARFTVEPMPATTAGVDAPRDRAQSLTGPADARTPWWSAFGGARVDALVRGALAASPTLDAALATLRQARELTQAQSATLWPTASIGVGAVQAHGGNAAIVNSGAPRSRSALLSAAYSPDVFGLNAQGVRQARAQEDAAAWQLQASRLTLAGALVVALANEKSAARVERLTAQLVDIDAATLAIVRSRESLGDLADTAVWAQQQQLHDRRTQLAAARLQAAQARDLLASLQGKPPADFVEPDIGLDDLALPDIPGQLPGEVVARRPDVRIAAAQLRAADAARAAAIAARLPQLSFGGDIGDVAAAAQKLFNPASLVWDLTASATQTLFDGGALRHRAAAAQAAADAQSSQYRAVIVNAFRDVADNLEALRHDAQADVDAVARADAARRQFEIARRSEALGQISHQDLLAAQAQAIQMDILQVQSRTTRLVDSVDLMVSLGGSAEAGAD